MTTQTEMLLTASEVAEIETGQAAQEIVQLKVRALKAELALAENEQRQVSERIAEFTLRQRAARGITPEKNAYIEKGHDGQYRWKVKE